MRINHLDGLRGLAILLVFFYHSYARWSEIVPYGDKWQSVIFFTFGNTGVQLFFLLSGFVIYMTLERSSGALTFIKKRWLRLFPAMLICSLLSYFTASFFIERPAGQPEFTDILPGLTLIDPDWLGWWTGLAFSPLEGAYWSIYVEVKFYLFAAVCYFFISKDKLPWFIFGAYLFAVSITQMPIISDLQWLEPIRWRIPFYSLEHFGWFASGCFFYRFMIDNKKYNFAIALAVGILASVTTSAGQTDKFFVLLFLVALFATSLISPVIQKILATRFLLFFGFISYPLYLIHENMLVASVIKLGKFVDPDVALLAPLVVLSGLSTVSYLIAKFAEPVIKNQLKTLTNVGNLRKKINKADL
ncbi:acyltransferase family protein [Glaciecola sp. 1036]|uniref:acyltransferase family protein n=1 Tax=Alteromonadaceae TaxID=72275 RepID=UPI003D0536F8